MALPTNVNYGTVEGQFILAYADSNDVDLFPDGQPAKGSIFFTPSPKKLLDALSTPNPVTIVPQTVEVQLDTQGYIEGYSGERGVRLVATDDSDLNPVDWTWSVEFRLTDQQDVPVPLAGFSFELPAGETIDLTTLTPVPDANGTYYLVGPTGPANELTVGTVNTLDAGEDATVEITGTSPSQTINFGIPKGQRPTITVGTTTTADPGDPAEVVNSGTLEDPILNFEIPKGDAATVNAGSASVLPYDSPATVTNSGTTSDAVFDFGIPRGEAGIVVSSTPPLDQNVVWVDTNEEVSAEDALNGGETGQTIISDSFLGSVFQYSSHNHIVNGAFDFWQRGDTFSATSIGYYADRWTINYSDNPPVSGTIEKQEFTAGELNATAFGEGKNYLRANVSFANVTDQLEIIYKVKDARTLLGSEVVFSLYIKENIDCYNSRATIRVHDGTDYISFDPSVDIGYVFFGPADGVWRRKWGSFSLPTIEDAVSPVTLTEDSYIELVFQPGKDLPTSLVADTSIWGAQLETGKIATPFKRNQNTLDGEFAACSNYYRRWKFENGQPLSAGIGLDASKVVGQIQYEPMRTLPAVTASGSFEAQPNGSAVTLSNFSVGESSIKFEGSGSGFSANNAYMITSTSDASYIEADSEIN